MFWQKVVFFLFSCIFFTIGVSAHEMWLEPVNYQVKLNDTILVDEKVGQDFKGNKYAYLASSYAELLITVNNKSRAVKSRIGDLPAIHEKAIEEGLTLLSSQTTTSVLTYDSWKIFVGFLKSKGLDWVLAAHKKRGLTQKDLTEAYTRYPKALVKVGEGKGKDKFMGMPLEWLAETNPYTAKKGAIKLKLFWKGKPLAHEHVGVFNRIKGKLIKTSLTTDAEGRVAVPRANGGKFLINAVQMIEATPDLEEDTGAKWESLWASMTYALEE